MVIGIRRVEARPPHGLPARMRLDVSVEGPEPLLGDAPNTTTTPRPLSKTMLDPERCEGVLGSARTYQVGAPDSTSQVRFWPVVLSMASVRNTSRRRTES